MAKALVGVVVSTKMTKTVVVDIERKFQHIKYKKIVKKNKKVMAHNEDLKLIEGDLVEIKETRPTSKNKHYVVVRKVEVLAGLAEHPRQSRDKKGK